MKFTGAIVKTEGKNIAVAVVADSFLTLPQAEKMAEMRRYATCLYDYVRRRRIRIFRSS